MYGKLKSLPRRLAVIDDLSGCVCVCVHCRLVVFGRRRKPSGYETSGTIYRQQERAIKLHTERTWLQLVACNAFLLVTEQRYTQSVCVWVLWSCISGRRINRIKKVDTWCRFLFPWCDCKPHIVIIWDGFSRPRHAIALLPRPCLLHIFLLAVF